MPIYDLGFVKVNGDLVTENTENDISIESDITRVLTIPKGFSGITPGSPVVVLTMKSAVPITGQEFNFARMMVRSIPCELQWQLGASGEQVTLDEAYVVGPVKLASAVGKTTEQDVTLVGRAPSDIFEKLGLEF
jgi:hypothetical protein